MNNDSSQEQIRVDVEGDIVTIRIKTDYGPIDFSYSPSEVEAGIAALSTDILKRSKEGKRLAGGMEQLGLPAELVADAAAQYEEQSNKSFPLDAIEKFSPSAKAYSRGTIEQFSDNLVPALILMLNYLASTALVLAGTDSDPRWEQKVRNEHKATVEMLQERFGASIRQLWIRQHRENVDADSQ